MFGTVVRRCVASSEQAVTANDAALGRLPTRIRVVRLGTAQSVTSTRLTESDSDVNSHLVRESSMATTGHRRRPSSGLRCHPGSPGDGLRRASIVLRGVGLILLLVGPTLRPPVRDSATRIVDAGRAIAANGVLYSSSWFPTSGRSPPATALSSRSPRTVSRSSPSVPSSAAALIHERGGDLGPVSGTPQPGNGTRAHRG